MGKYKVTPSIGINIRSGPGTGYGKVGAYPMGTVVDVLEARDGWGRTDKGWVSLTYLEAVEGPQRVTDTGLAIGLPVGMLGIQLDVIVKILNGFVVEKSQKFCNEGKFNQMNAILWVCPALFGLCAALPVFVSVTLGQPAVNWLLEVMPQWFLSGLTLAGKMLPAIGIAMLLRYMPTGKYFQYLLAGFFLSAFLNVPIIGAAIVGVALAIAFYQRAERDTELAAHASADAFIGEDE